MKNVIRKITTWLLVFGMTFTPVLTSIDAVVANASEEQGTIVVNSEEPTVKEDGGAPVVSEGEAPAEPAPSAEVQKAVDEADAAVKKEEKLDEKVEAVDEAVKTLVEDGVVNKYGETVLEDKGLKKVVGVADALIADADNQTEIIKTTEAAINSNLNLADKKADEAEKIADDLDQKLDDAATQINELNKRIINADTIDEANGAFASALSVRNETGKFYTESVTNFNTVNGQYEKALEDVANKRKDYEAALKKGGQDVVFAKKNLDDAIEYAEALQNKADQKEVEIWVSYAGTVAAAEAVVKGASIANDKAQQAAKDAKKDYDDASRKEGKAKTEYDNAVKAEAQAKKAWENAGKTEGELKAAYETAQAETNRLKGIYDGLKEETGKKEKASKEANDKAVQAEKDLNQAVLDQKRAASDVTAQEKSIKKAEKELEGLKKEAGTAQKTFDYWDGLYQAAVKKQTELNQQIGTLNSEISTLNVYISGLTQSIKNKEGELGKETDAADENGSLYAKLKDAQAKLKAAEDEKKGLEDQLGSKDDVKDETGNYPDTAFGALNQAKDERDAEQAKLDELNENLEDYQKDLEAARKVLEEKELIAKVWGIEDTEINTYNSGADYKEADKNLAKNLIIYQIYMDTKPTSEEEVLAGKKALLLTDNAFTFNDKGDEVTVTYQVGDETVTKVYKITDRHESNIHGKTDSAHWLVISEKTTTMVPQPDKWGVKDTQEVDKYYSRSKDIGKSNKAVDLSKYENDANYVKESVTGHNGHWDLTAVRFTSYYTEDVYELQWVGSGKGRHRENVKIHSAGDIKEQTDWYYKDTVTVNIEGWIPQDPVEQETLTEYVTEASFFRAYVNVDRDKNVSDAQGVYNTAKALIYMEDGTALVDYYASLIGTENDSPDANTLWGNVNKKAKEVETLKNQIQALETNVIPGLETAVQTASTNVETAKSTLKGMREQLAGMKDDLKKKQGALLQAQKDLANVTAQINGVGYGWNHKPGLKDYRNGAEGALTTANGKVTKKTNEIAELKKALPGLEEAKKKADEKVEEKRTEYKRLDDEAKKAARLLNQAKDNEKKAKNAYEAAKKISDQAKTNWDRAKIFTGLKKNDYDKAQATTANKLEAYNAAKKNRESFEKTYNEKKQAADKAKQTLEKTRKWADGVEAEAKKEYEKKYAELEELKSAAKAAKKAAEKAKKEVKDLEDALNALKKKQKKDAKAMDAQIKDLELQVAAAKEIMDKAGDKVKELDELIKKAEGDLDNTIDRIVEDHERRVAEEGGEGGGTPAGYIAPVAGAGEIVLIPLTGGTGVAGVRTGRTVADAGTDEGTSTPAVTSNTTPATTLEDEALPAAAEAATNLEDTQLPAAQGATEAGMNLWWLWAAIAVLVALGFGVYKYVDNNKKKANTK